MFYDPTPPLSSSWSEWTDRFNMPSHYDDEDWLRPLGGQNRSSSNPRLRRFDIVDDSPRMSRTSSRSDVEMQSGDESAEAETSNSRPPRVHRIPIFVEDRQSSQESTDSPDIPDVNELKKEWESIHSNTVPRFRRNRDLESEDDLQRSRSHTDAFRRPRTRYNSEQQDEPRRRRPNVTTVKVNCDREQSNREQSKNDPKKEEQMSVIEGVVKEVEELKKQVENISGKESKHCRYLDEMLTRCMLKLDNVDTMGEEDIRVARKIAIRNVQCCIDSLESKIHPPVAKDESVNKSPEPADKGVIVLPFYNGKSREPETTNGGQENVETDRKVIVLPYNNDTQDGSSKSPEKTVIVLPYHVSEKDSITPAEKPKSPDEKTVIVLPYHETPLKNGTEITTTSPGQKSPEKTVIMLPYQVEDSGKNIIPLPYYDTPEIDSNNNNDESVCTKL